MIFFNKVCYCWVQGTFLNSAPPECNSNATRWWSFVTPLAVKYDLKHRFHRTAKFVGSSLRLKQGSPLASVLNKFAELGAYSPLDALSLFYDMSIFKRTLCIYKTVEIHFPTVTKTFFLVAKVISQSGFRNTTYSLFLSQIDLISHT